MNYKEFLITLLFMLCFSGNLLVAQERNASDLITLIEIYSSLDNNTEKYKELNKIKGMMKNMPKDSLDYILKTYDTNFIARFAMADYYRLKQNHVLAKDKYEALEHAILKKDPVDYTLLAFTVMYSSQNISFETFTYEKGLKELYKGLRYAELSKVDKSILDYHSNLSFYNTSIANYEQGIYHNKKTYDIAIKIKDTTQIIYALKTIMENFNATNDYESSLNIWNQIQPIFKLQQFKYPYASQLLSYPTEAFINTKQFDSAAYYNTECFLFDSIQGFTHRTTYNLLDKGRILIGVGKIDEAKKALLKSYDEAKNNKNAFIQIRSSIYLSRIYLKEGKYKQALELLKYNYSISGTKRNLIKSQFELALSQTFEANNILDSAIFYRNKFDKTLEAEKFIMLEKQVALAKAELGINELLTQNENLASSKLALDERIVKTNKTKNLLLYSFLILLLLLGLFIYHRNQKEKLRISTYKAELTNKERIAIEAELNTIRSQMNPHFMFNSLNSINEFIQNDSSEDASNYLVKFSRLMRSTLNYSKRKFVTLGEEIDLLKLYVQLENLRFYNSIDFSLTIDQTIDSNKVLIPPMMIQPFVENAIWHGLMAKEKNRKLSLSFSETKQNIICNIEDNGIGRTASAEQKTHRSKHKSQGIGLTQRRLELLKNIHGKEAGIEVVDLKDSEKAIGTLVKVILPKQIDV